MTYTPPKTRQPQAPALAGALPKDLANALTGAEQVLRERDKLHSALVRTHEQIPELLARRADAQSKLAAAEVSGTDAASIRDERLRIESERLSAVARRAGAIEALLEQETPLAAARDTLNTARQPYAAGAVAEFQRKYADAILALQTAWAEGDELARAMRCDVPMPLPVKVFGGPKPTLMGIGVPEFDPITISRVPGTDLQPVTIDPVAQRVGSALNRLDGALNFANGIKTAQRMQAQLSMRTTSRGFDPSPSAVYVVAERFVSHFDNLSFEPGTLVDVSLLGLVTLQRLTSTKKLRLVQGETRAAA